MVISPLLRATWAKRLLLALNKGDVGNCLAMVRGISTGSVNLLKNRAELPVERCDISVVGVMWYFYTRLHYTVSNSLYPVLVFLSLSSNTVFQSLFYYLIIFIYSLGIFRDSSNDGIPLLQGLQS